MNRADAVQWFGEDGFRLLMVEPAASRREVATSVAELAARYGMSATSSDSIAAEVASAIGRILALLGALVGIGLLIGGFGTANTMLMNLAERRQELDVLWAVGMSRMQLRVMAVVEAGMMGLMGGLLGGIIGGVLAWLLVSFSRTPGFQPEFVYSWPAALVGVALAVLAACFAATVPAGRIISQVGR
jgi:putative ABC transport system permease protein